MFQEKRTSNQYTQNFRVFNPEYLNVSICLFLNKFIKIIVLQSKKWMETFQKVRMVNLKKIHKLENNTLH